MTLKGLSSTREIMPVIASLIQQVVEDEQVIVVIIDDEDIHGENP